jgi:hypothetical protein
MKMRKRNQKPAPWLVTSCTPNWDHFDETTIVNALHLPPRTYAFKFNPVDKNPFLEVLCWGIRSQTPCWT